VPGKEDGAGSKDDSACGEDIEGRCRKQDPEGGEKEDADEKCGQGWASSGRSCSSLGREEIGHDQEGLKQGVASPCQLLQCLDDFVE